MTATPLDRSRLSLAGVDIFERAVVACLFGFFTFRMVVAFLESREPIYVILILSEGLAAFFILIRRSAKTVSMNPIDWILAFVPTIAPLLAAPAVDAAPLAPVAICALLSCAGLGLQIAAKLTLRRNFGIVAANRGITTGGPYLFVRHPMYLAYLLTWIGFFLANPSAWNLFIYGVALAFQLARLQAEEQLLSKDELYRAFMRSVPYRLVPMVF